MVKLISNLSIVVIFCIIVKIIRKFFIPNLGGDFKNYFLEQIGIQRLPRSPFSVDDVFKEINFIILNKKLDLGIYSTWTCLKTS